MSFRGQRHLESLFLGQAARQSHGVPGDHRPREQRSVKAAASALRSTPPRAASSSTSASISTLLSTIRLTASFATFAGRRLGTDVVNGTGHRLQHRARALLVLIRAGQPHVQAGGLGRVGSPRNGRRHQRSAGPRVSSASVRTSSGETVLIDTCKPPRPRRARFRPVPS